MKSCFRIKQAVSLFICLIVVSLLAIRKHHELFGYSLKSELKAETASNATLRMLGNGRAEINTSALASNIMGYGGKVPLKIIIKNGVVENIIALKNDETKEFFSNASTLFEKWKGQTIDKAINMKVDAVTGATFSSKAIIENMHQGLLYAKAHVKAEESRSSNNLSSTDNSSSSLFSLRNIIGISVILMAAILPLFVKNRRFRFCQQILNVIVLGFWCGTCLSYTSLLGFAAHGMEISGSIIAIALLFIAISFVITRLYCRFVCPMGTLIKFSQTSIVK